VSEPSLPEKVVAIDRGLGEARIAHAFGGALALAYYAEPRATIDIDVNVFISPAESAAVLRALSPLGVEDRGVGPREVARDGQCRWWWGRTPVDLFFAYDQLHTAMRESIRRVPFGDAQIPILAPQHLVVCKALFDRAKDWIDIEQIVAATPELDRKDIGDWLRRLIGDDDPRAVRFKELAGRF
jgi:hypothetical protein